MERGAGWVHVGTCVHYAKQGILTVLFTLHEKAMFSQIFCYLCGAILLSTKAICLKLMRRLVSISVDYMMGERYISYRISHVL